MRFWSVNLTAAIAVLFFCGCSCSGPGGETDGGALGPRDTGTEPLDAGRDAAPDDAAARMDAAADAAADVDAARDAGFVVPLGLPTHVAVGGSMCALFESGRVLCWGRNQFGQLGDGTTELRTSPVAVEGLEDAVQLSVGHHFACAVRESGQVACWGDNANGQLGPAATGGQSAVPVAIRGLDDARLVAAGSRHACAVHVDGTVSCWGANDHGQLGDGGTTASSAPVVVDSLEHVADLTVGSDFSCAVLSDGAPFGERGSTWCWGNDVVGQLGDGAPRDGSPRPSRVSMSSRSSIAIDAGGQHACAIRTSGELVCWGANDRGQLGDGLTTGAGSDVPMPVAGLDASVVEVSGGAAHTCARIAGDVYCWGKNGAGELGRGTFGGESPDAREVTAPGGAVQVAAGAEHTCVLTDADEVYCFGANSVGELGRAPSPAEPTAVPITFD